MPQTTVAGLAYDRETDRWTLAGRSLHCSDGLEIQVAGRWLSVRLEYDGKHGWILYADTSTRILPSRHMPARPDPRDHRW